MRLWDWSWLKLNLFCKLVNVWVFLLTLNALKIYGICQQILNFKYFNSVAQAKTDGLKNWRFLETHLNYISRLFKPEMRYYFYFMDFGSRRWVIVQHRMVKSDCKYLRLSRVVHHKKFSKNLKMALNVFKKFNQLKIIKQLFTDLQ